MHLPTEDPTAWIVEQSEERVVYENIDGEVWEILGTCNMCGACEGGEERNLQWVGEKGTPGACIDLDYPNRLDRPVRPEIKNDFPECSLSGSYLKNAS